MKKNLTILFIRVHILGEFFKTLWKFKLWWAIPVVFILLFFLVLFFIAGHTGIAAFIYPLF